MEYDELCDACEDSEDASSPYDLEDVKGVEINILGYHICVTPHNVDLAIEL